MMRSLMAPLFVLAAATAARAQEGLTPTDVLDFGQLTVTGRLQMSFTDFTQKDDAPSTDLDLESRDYGLILNAALGLGRGWEVEVRLPWQFTGEFEGDGDFGGVEAELEQEVRGVGDLEVNLNYRIVEESAALPNWIFGVIVVAPTGNDKDGDASVVLAGVEVQEEREGAIGDGVWKYGLQTGLSKRFGVVEPYAATSYVFGDTRRENGVTEDAPSVWTLLAGSEIHLGIATIDLRAFAVHTGKETFEDAAAEARSEAFWSYGAQGSLYLTIVPRATLILSGGLFLAEDHELNDLREVDGEDFQSFFIQVGLHLFLGLDTK